MACASTTLSPFLSSFARSIVRAIRPSVPRSKATISPNSSVSIAVTASLTACVCSENCGRRTPAGEISLSVNNSWGGLGSSARSGCEVAPTTATALRPKRQTSRRREQARACLESHWDDALIRLANKELMP